MCNPFPGSSQFHDEHPWFASKFSGDGQELLFSTVYGGVEGYENYQGVSDIKLLHDDLVMVCGYTNSRDYPSSTPYTAGKDLFITVFDPTVPEVVGSFLYGGEKNEVYAAVGLNAEKNIWVAGMTNSESLPLVTPYDDELSGFSDLFLAEFVVPGIWACGLRFDHFEHEAQNEYHPGDRFHLGVTITNADPVSHAVEEYIIVEAFGNFYYRPAWTNEPYGDPMGLGPAAEVSHEIADFIWPEGVGSGRDIRFWGALVDVATGLLAGEYDVYGFDFSE
ncbi:hypothetical protein JW905_03545 [bacterium]|nr:hypothetical protein [candidate division CSSED10-310 bacterium]